MARSRNIKPGFFKNEQLGGLPFETRLLFPGLWILSDREGRLEDRPLKIKAELFPFDVLDVDPLLNALHDVGLILRYETNGARYIQVVNFKRHQNPHTKEAASTIPAPGSPSSSTMRAPDKHRSSPADSLSLDSLSSDSLNPGTPDFSVLAERLYLQHPNREGKILAEQALAELLAASPDREGLARAIESGHAAQLPTLQRKGAYCPQLHRWLREERYKDLPPGDSVNGHVSEENY